MKDLFKARIQLDNGYHLAVLFLFVGIPLLVIAQIIIQFSGKINLFGIFANGLFILFWLIFALRVLKIKKVSFDNSNFYVTSLFKNDEISIPISRITSFKKAFINLRYTDMFLIRYKNYDSKETLVKFIRHRDHNSIKQFREQIEKNKSTADDSLRGIVKNKF